MYENMARVTIYKLPYWFVSFETDNAVIGNWKHAGKFNQGIDILCVLFFFFLTMAVLRNARHSRELHLFLFLPFSTL